MPPHLTLSVQGVEQSPQLESALVSVRGRYQDGRDSGPARLDDMADRGAKSSED